MKIAVLYGGGGDEHAVSLASGERVVEALIARGHTVESFLLEKIALSPTMGRVLAASDAVFLALHGGGGEDGTIQNLMEQAGIFHYTGSSPAASRLAMRKDAARERVAMFGVPVARGACVDKGEGVPAALASPVVVKPIAGGSSVGLRILRTREETDAFVADDTLLCEEYLSGREYSVSILGGVALPPVEIRPRGGVYDYYHKYTAGATEEICPVLLPPLVSEYLKTLARASFAALGLRDYARIDLREDASGKPHFLEANTLPGLTATSLLPLAASVAGISFPLLCERIADFAAARKRGES